MLLRLRRYRWRRIRRERVVTRGASGTLESPATRSPRPSVDGAGADGRPRTPEEIGQGLHVTRERVRQIESRALQKMRSPQASKKMVDYVAHLG